MSDFYRTTDGQTALNADAQSRRMPQDHIMTHAALRPTRSMRSEIGTVVRIAVALAAVLTAAFIVGFNL